MVTIPLVTRPFSLVSPQTLRRKGPPRSDDLLRVLCATGEDNSVKAIVARYRKITRGTRSKMQLAVHDQKIASCLLSPVRNAIVSYMVGNYLGTIAACGMACEMLAVFSYDIADIRVQNAPISFGSWTIRRRFRRPACRRKRPRLFDSRFGTAASRNARYTDNSLSIASSRSPGSNGFAMTSAPGSARLTSASLPVT